jgi:hypothetical protein
MLAAMAATTSAKITTAAAVSPQARIPSSFMADPTPPFLERLSTCGCRSRIDPEAGLWASTSWNWGATLHARLRW